MTDHEDDDTDEADEEIEALETLIEDFEAREGVEEDDDFELANAIEDPEPEEIASFMLSNGNAIRFLASPVATEVFVGEISAEGSEAMVLDGPMSPVSLYARLAETRASVPQALSRLDRTGLFEGRKVIDAVSGEMEVDLSAMAGLSLPSAVEQTGSCAADPAGRNYFSSHHCGSGGGPGYGKSESYCYPNASHWIQKTSSGRRRATWTKIAACGSSTCRLIHRHKKASGWHTALTVNVTPPRVEGWWSYKKGIRRTRQVRFERLGNNAIVRGWVQYHSQVADWS